MLWGVVSKSVSQKGWTWFSELKCHRFGAGKKTFANLNSKGVLMTCQQPLPAHGKVDHMLFHVAGITAPRHIRDTMTHQQTVSKMKTAHCISFFLLRQLSA